MSRRIVVLLFFCGLSMHAVAQVVFPVSFDASAKVLSDGERAQITSHLQAAGQRWMQALGIGDARSIELQVVINNAPTANGGSATSVAIGTIGGRTTYEQGVAGELHSGIDPNGAAVDATVYIGLNYLRNELWFDLDPTQRTATVPSNRTDAMSVMLHEFGHILAYNGWADPSTGVPPPTYWSIFDRWMQPGSPTVIVGAQSVQAWGSAPALTTGNINHWGNAALREARLDGLTRAPVEWRDGVPLPQPPCTLPPSIDAPPSAWRQDRQASASLIDQLMNGVVFYRGSRYDISALDLGLMRDVQLQNEFIFRNGFEAAL